MDGRVAAAGQNFYDAKNYQALATTLTLPYAIDSEFQETKINFGFHYFPPTILLHYPLGFLDYGGAHVVWVGMLVAAMAGCVALAYLIYLRAWGTAGLLAAAGLYLLFPPLRYGLYFEQTSVIMLVPYLLFWRDRDHDRAGVWAALAVGVKPLGAFLWLYLLLRRKWKALGIATAVFAALCAVVVPICGLAGMTTAFNPFRFSGVVDYRFSEYVSQSLLKEIITRIGPSPWGGPMTHPVFLVLGPALFAVCAWTIARLPRDREPLALAILLPLSLVLYPGSLNHYSVLVLPALFWLGLSRDAWRWIVVGAVYAMMPLNLNTWAHLLMLGVLLGMAWKPVRPAVA